LARGIDVFGSPMAVVVGAVASTLVLIGCSMIYTLRLPCSDTLGTGLYYGFSGRDGGVDICFERRNDLKGSRYSTLELMASDTMTITAVNWWSGYRIGAP
jgi:hypothetical protein